MGACACGYTRDEEKNCDGTHKVVKAVKADLAEKLEANGFPHASEYVKNNYSLYLPNISRLDMQGSAFRLTISVLARDKQT